MLALIFGVAACDAPTTSPADSGVVVVSASVPSPMDPLPASVSVASSSGGAPAIEPGAHTHSGIVIPPPSAYESEPARFLPSNPGCAVPKGMPTWRWDTLRKVEGLDVDAVVMTMDAGARLPDLERTLGVLREKDVQATMFLYTRELAASPRGKEIVEGILADGHELGNHTLSHRDLTKLAEGDVALDVDAVEKFVHDATGATTKPFFRAPFLAFDAAVDRVIQKHCYRSIWITIDTRDDREGTRADDIIRAVLEDHGKPRAFERGTILLFHGSQPENMKALPVVIDGIRASGFSILRLSDALRMAKPATRPVP